MMEMSTVSINIKNMPDPVWRQVKVLAIERKCRIVDVVVDALTDYLKKESRK